MKEYDCVYPLFHWNTANNLPQFVLTGEASQPEILSQTVYSRLCVCDIVFYTTLSYLKQKHII